MIVVGERINSSRKTINEAVVKKDVKFIQQEAINQVNSGADFLDINCGTSINSEISDMEWLVTSVMEVTDVPLVIDSPSAKAIEHGLDTYFNVAKKKNITPARPMVNSITGEKSRMDDILPLVKKYNTAVVALTMDEEGMPHSADQRFNVAKKVVDTAKKYDIPATDIYFDCLVRPISTEPEQVKEFMDALSQIKSQLTGAKSICGLSNISFGLPNRSLINSFFFAISMYNGLDAAVIDITQKEMRTGLFAANVIMNQDEFCMNYISAIREGKI
jgi:5-methyltetrahydrofolate--homocysteine methyltransferase